MTGDRMLVTGVDAVAADAVATMLPAGAVPVEAPFLMDGHMGAPLRGAEEQQISRSQQAVIAWVDPCLLYTSDAADE